VPDENHQEPSERAEFQFEMEPMGKISFGANFSSRSSRTLIAVTGLLAMIGGPVAIFAVGSSSAVPVAYLVAISVIEIASVGLTVYLLLRGRSPSS
jgi:hypothetical protein